MMTHEEMNEMIGVAEFFAMLRDEDPLQLCARNYVSVITPHITALDVQDGTVMLGLDPIIEADANQFLRALQNHYGEEEINIAINTILLSAAEQAQAIHNALVALFG